MRNLRKTMVAAAVCTLATASYAQEKIILLNEGSWQADNAKVTYFENGTVVSNQWFRDVNGTKLGDTPNDIIQLKDHLLAIAVNWSNIVQFIDDKGKAVAATEGVPNNRKLASDGENVYVTSYAHECGSRTFQKGYVAKISLDSFGVTDAVEVGYEPEGIAYYKGYLFVANSGGYAFQEDHDYERTVSVIDAKTMTVTRTIDTGCINLYGAMSQSGQYLCINSAGDYYNQAAKGVVLDCQAVLDGKPDASCMGVMDYALTYNTPTQDGKFLAIGSRFSYNTGEYIFNYVTIDPATVVLSGGESGVSAGLPGDLEEGIKSMMSPYCLYQNPYTGYYYATDAASYGGAGQLWQWSPEGKLLGKHKVYINPGSIVALPPDGHFSGVEDIAVQGPADDGTIYNLQGMPVSTPQPGQIYIRGGKKVLWR